MRNAAAAIRLWVGYGTRFDVDTKMSTSNLVPYPRIPASIAMRAFDAMMTMKKIDIAAIETAVRA